MSTASLVRDTIAFLRWRLVAVRALGKLGSLLRAKKAPGPAPSVAAMDDACLSRLQNNGWSKAPSPDLETLRAIADLYTPRAKDVVPTDVGHPFENIVRPEDFEASNPLFQFAFSDAILGAASAYFAGKFSIASIQVMRSYPTHGSLRESQKWHRDYGDATSLHFIMYLTDVIRPEHGPFVFLEKSASRRVRRSPIIRRLTDEQIRLETGAYRFEVFHGRSGDAIFVDPAACYHFGSRCAVPRTAVFITFNTHAPYSRMMEPLSRHRRRAAAEAKKVRPDLPGEYIDRILQV